MVSGPPALVLHAKRFAATGRLSSLWLVFQVWAFSVSLSTRERFTVGAELPGDILASEARRGLFVSHVRPKENGEQVQIESRRQARCGRSHPLEGVRLRHAMRQSRFRGRLFKSNRDGLVFTSRPRHLWKQQSTPFVRRLRRVRDNPLNV